MKRSYLRTMPTKCGALSVYGTVRRALSEPRMTVIADCLGCDAANSQAALRPSSTVTVVSAR